MLGTDLAVALRSSGLAVAVYDLPDFDMTQPAQLEAVTAGASSSPAAPDADPVDSDDDPSAVPRSQPKPEEEKEAHRCSIVFSRSSQK